MKMWIGGVRATLNANELRRDRMKSIGQLQRQLATSEQQYRRRFKNKIITVQRQKKPGRMAIDDEKRAQATTNKLE